MRRVALLASLAACAPPRVDARFPVPPRVGELVTVDAEFARFAARVRGYVDGAADEDRLFVRSMLDALDGTWAAAIADLDRAAALETDPKTKVMLGLTIRVWNDARTHEGDGAAGFRAALDRALARLPIEDTNVRDALQMLRAMGETFTPPICAQLVDEAVKPSDGAIPWADVQTIVFQRYAAVRLAPVGKIIDEELAAHGIALPVP